MPSDVIFASKERCRRYNGTNGNDPVELKNFYINILSRTVHSFECNFSCENKCYAAIGEDGKIVRNDIDNESDIQSCTYTNRHLDRDLVENGLLEQTRISKKPEIEHPLKIIHSGDVSSEKMPDERSRDNIYA